MPDMLKHAPLELAFALIAPTESPAARCQHEIPAAMKEDAPQIPRCHDVRFSRTMTMPEPLQRSQAKLPIGLTDPVPASTHDVGAGTSLPT